MPVLDYRLINVFTREAEVFSGNPLCVFEPATELPVDTMQAIAKQFNLSETTFILPSTRANARVRIFTPGFEMPFAGHPTLGTAAVCRSLGLGGDSLTLEMAAGLIPVSAHGRRLTLTAQKPSWREVDESGATLAPLLGLSAGDLLDRPLWISTGREQLIVPVANAAAVRRANPSAEIFTRLKNQDGQGMAYLFAPTSHDRILSRFFFPRGSSVSEDPATGSAAANLGGWWLAMGRPLPWAVQISQGEQLQRPSTLYLTVDAHAQIQVAGDVIELGRGHIEIPG